MVIIAWLMEFLQVPGTVRSALYIIYLFNQESCCKVGNNSTHYDDDDDVTMIHNYYLHFVDEENEAQ